MPNRSANSYFATVLLTALLPNVSFAGPKDTPLVRGPGVSQETLEAVAAGHGRQILSDYLDLNRPDEDSATRLTRLVERAQAQWLSGSVEAARASFREIAKLAQSADWRDSQREAIHYAMLRLAQSATTPIERDEWLEKALKSFIDLSPDADLFPPPLLEDFASLKERVVAQSFLYSPNEHFPEHRILLINGKKYVLSPDLKIRLPKASFRITVLSDAFEPMTEQLTSSQLQAFRLSLPAIATGTCLSPEGASGMKGVDQIGVVYSADCLRSRSSSGWQPRDSEQTESLRPPSMADLAQLPPDPFKNFPAEEKPAISKKTWFWIGLAVLATGAAAWVHYESE